ncbi:MAG TPA: hypothetical protein VG816_10580 [Solirubrobacterales bacterium]|nr:hypothetical protein [Solirubrobacterales bacterium]
MAGQLRLHRGLRPTSALAGTAAVLALLFVPSGAGASIPAARTAKPFAGPEHGKHRHEKRHRHKRRKVVRSNGGPVKAALGAVAVHAPRGAIRKGQTLTIEAKAPGGLAPDARSIAGGPYSVSTSQGEPAKPVLITFRYDKDALTPGSGPLVLHGSRRLGAWLPEQTRVNRGAGTATAAFDSFSPMDVVDSITWAAGDLTGNRTDLPTGCGEPPSWVDGVHLPFARNDSLPACIGAESSGDTLYLHVANNRGYAQYVTISNASLDLRRSNWSDSLEGLFANQLAAHAPGNSASSFLLAPGSHATLAIDKPPPSLGNTAVSLQVAPQGASAMAEMGWALLKKAKEEIGLPVEVGNCVVGQVYAALSNDPSAPAAVKRLRTCADAAASLKGVAKKALEKIAAAILVTDFFYKVVDLEAAEPYPVELSFTIRGKNPTNPDIHLGNLGYGSLPAGQPTVEHLTASGGSPPYTFRVSNGQGNPERVPSWVQLAADGTLTITPPPGTNQSVGFYVYATDASGQSSPFERDEVTFSVSGEPNPGTGVWTTSKGVLPADSVGEALGFPPLVSACETSACLVFGPYGTGSGLQNMIQSLSPKTDWTSDEAPLPAGATGVTSEYPHTACMAAGTCVLTTSYEDASSDEWTALGELSNGTVTWTAAPVPADAGPGAPYVDSVACSPSDTCVAAGYFLEGTYKRGLLETYTGGTWHAEWAPSPPGWPTDQPSPPFEPSVTCGEGSSCVAISGSSDESGDPSLLAETLAGGSWTPTVVALPGDAASDPAINSIACPTAQHCVGVGSYLDTGGDVQPLIASDSGAGWTAAKPALPLTSSGEYAVLTSTDCLDATRCVAVGYDYEFDGGSTESRGLIYTLEEGTWRPQWAPLPPMGEGSRLLDAACATSGACFAVGDYSAGPYGGLPHTGLIETFAGKSWAPSEVPTPNDASPGNLGGLSTVSCGDGELCVASGTYRDQDGHPQVLLAKHRRDAGPTSASDSTLATSSGPPLRLANWPRELHLRERAPRS